MEIKTVNNVKIVVLNNKVDAFSAKEVEALLTELIESGNKEILCDFSKTGYISSAGLRVFLLTAKRIKQISGILILFSLQARVSEVFETAGLIKLFQVFASEEQALKAIEK